MRGRDYDPSQRRFLTPDPIIAHPLSSQGFSPYAYVSNNPLSRTDPTGFFDGFTDEDRPGVVHGGNFEDASGLPDIDGGGGGAGGGGGGGMSVDYDDYDGGDFDPGEAMAGQDEEGGNDGTDAWSESGSGKQGRGAGWELPDRFEIDGPEAEYFRYLFQSAMERSPSFAARVQHHARYGRETVRLHTVSRAWRIVVGASSVANEDLGRNGEHWLDAHDFSLSPPVPTVGDGTSAEQRLVHEVVEAIREIENDATWTLPDDGMAYSQAVDAAWEDAHREALEGEREFRQDNGQAGFLIDHTVLDHNLIDLYTGVPDVIVWADELDPPYFR